MVAKEPIIIAGVGAVILIVSYLASLGPMDITAFRSQVADVKFEFMPSLSHQVMYMEVENRQAVPDLLGLGFIINETNFNATGISNIRLSVYGTKPVTRENVTCVTKVEEVYHKDNNTWANLTSMECTRKPYVVYEPGWVEVTDGSITLEPKIGKDSGTKRFKLEFDTPIVERPGIGWGSKGVVWLNITSRNYAKNIVLVDKEGNSSWFDTNYAYKMNTTCAGCALDEVYVINGSSGFNLGDGALIVWARWTNGTDAVYWNSSTVWTVGNATNELNHDQEDGDGLNAETMWSSDDKLMLRFGMNATAKLTDSTGARDSTTASAGSSFTGKFANAINFSNGPYYGDIQNTNVDNTTFSFWIRSTAPSSGCPDDYIMDVRGGAFPWYFFSVPDFNCGQVRAYFHDGTNIRDLRSTPTVVNDGNFHHVAVTTNTIDGMKMYVNGNVVSTAAALPAGFIPGMPYGIGSYASGTANFIDAILDEMRIYNETKADDWANRSYNLDYTLKAVETPPAVDTCTYTSGNWVVNCADNCTIIANVDMGGVNNLTIYGTGRFLIKANITEFNQPTINDTCTVAIEEGLGRLGGL